MEICFLWLIESYKNLVISVFIVLWQRHDFIEQNILPVSGHVTSPIPPSSPTQVLFFAHFPSPVPLNGNKSLFTQTHSHVLHM